MFILGLLCLACESILLVFVCSQKDIRPNLCGVVLKMKSATFPEKCIPVKQPSHPFSLLRLFKLHKFQNLPLLLFCLFLSSTERAFNASISYGSSKKGRVYQKQRHKPSFLAELSEKETT